MSTAAVTAIAYGAPAAGGSQIVTSRPDAQSSTISRARNDSQPSQARVCFDDQIQTVGAPANFRLVGYDEDDVVPGNTAVIDVSAPPASRQCILVEFNGPGPGNSGIDIANYTAVEVLAGTVQDVGANPNQQGAVALEGTRQTPSQGNTSGPNLINNPITTRNASQMQFTFQYDTPIAAANAAAFHAYLGDTGCANQGACAARRDGNTTAINNTANGSLVTVTFTATPEEINRIARVGVDDGGLTSVAGDPSTEDAAGGSTVELPEITQVTQINNNTFEATYDEVVANVTANLFTVYADDGTLFDCNTFARPGDGTRVRFICPVQDFNEKIVKVADRAGAVEDVEGNDSPEQAVGIRTANIASGFTNAPDLRSITVDVASRQVVYTFDSRINQTTPVFASFGVVLDDATRLNGESLNGVSADGLQVTIGYASRTVSEFNRIRGGTVDVAAVADFQPAQNRINTVGTGAPTGTTGPTPTTGGQPTTTSPPPTTTSPPPTTTSPPPTTTSPPPTTTTTTTGPPPPTGRIRPNMTRPNVSARQRGNQIIVRVRGRLLGVQGRPCGGRTRVGLRIANRTRSQRVVRMTSACRYTATLRTSVRRLPRRLRNRRRVLIARVTARFQGNSQLLSDLSPTRRARVRR